LNRFSDTALPTFGIAHALLAFPATHRRANPKARGKQLDDAIAADEAWLAGH
jgi:hypothetical protein